MSSVVRPPASVTLILSNSDVEKVLTTADCMEVLEDAYVELSEGRGVNRVRSDCLVPSRPAHGGLCGARHRPDPLLQSEFEALQRVCKGYGCGSWCRDPASVRKAALFCAACARGLRLRLEKPRGHGARPHVDGDAQPRIARPLPTLRHADHAAPGLVAHVDRAGRGCSFGATNTHLP
jgi:hypothetical protein